MTADIQFTIWDEETIKGQKEKILPFVNELEQVEEMSEEDRILLANAMEQGMNDAFEESLSNDNQI